MAGFRERVADFVDLRVVPYPAVTMAVDLGDELLIDDDRGPSHRDIVVVGVAPNGARVQGRGIEALQMRLSPLLAYAVLGSAADLSGSVVALDDLWGRDALRVQDQLRAARSWEQRFAIAEAALARRLETGPAVDPEVTFAWRKLAITHGVVQVERLAEEVGWSRKRLWSRFRSQIGLTPKHAARLVRFDHAAHRLASGDSPAQVAAEGGYADQSHLHRDVTTFAGMTPTAVAAAPWLAVDDVAWPYPHDTSRR
jgi:AraC-like DNA-binding protein